MSGNISMNDDEYHTRCVILWAVKTWRISMSEILIMPLAEFEKWCAASMNASVNDEAQEKN